MVLSADFVKYIRYNILDFAVGNKYVYQSAKTVGQFVNLSRKVEHGRGNLAAEQYFNQIEYRGNVFYAVRVYVVKYLGRDSIYRIDNRVKLEVCACGTELFKFYFGIQPVDFVKYGIDISVNAGGFFARFERHNRKSIGLVILIDVLIFGRVFRERKRGKYVAERRGEFGHVNGKIPTGITDLSVNYEHDELNYRVNVFCIFKTLRFIGEYVLQRSLYYFRNRSDDVVESEISGRGNKILQRSAFIKLIDFVKHRAQIIVAGEIVTERGRKYCSERRGNIGNGNGKIPFRITDFASEYKFYKLADGG